MLHPIRKNKSEFPAVKKNLKKARGYDIIAYAEASLMD
jgi:hypothetical protein